MQMTAERFGSDLLKATGNVWSRLQYEMGACREVREGVEWAP